MDWDKIVQSELRRVEFLVDDPPILVCHTADGCCTVEPVDGDNVCVTDCDSPFNQVIVPRFEVRHFLERHYYTPEALSYDFMDAVLDKIVEEVDFSVVEVCDGYVELKDKPEVKVVIKINANDVGLIFKYNIIDYIYSGRLEEYRVHVPAFLIADTIAMYLFTDASGDYDSGYTINRVDDVIRLLDGVKSAGSSHVVEVWADDHFILEQYDADLLRLAEELSDPGLKVRPSVFVKWIETHFPWICHAPFIVVDDFGNELMASALIFMQAQKLPEGYAKSAQAALELLGLSKLTCESLVSYVDENLYKELIRWLLGLVTDEK